MAERVVRTITRATLQRGPCMSNRGKSAGSIRCLCIFYNNCITGTCMTFKMEVKVTEYNSHSGAIRWRISKSHNWASFASSNQFRDIHISNFVTLQYRSSSLHKIFASIGAIRGKHITYYLMAVVMYAFSTFTCKNSHLKSLTLEVEVSVTKYNIRNGPIHRWISTSITIISDHFFTSSHRFRGIHISAFVTLQM